MKKGFTLIELMASIVILAVIMVIIMPSMIDILNRSKTSLNEEQISQLEYSASQWGLDNLSQTNGTPSQSYVTLETLKNAGFLENKQIKDITSKENINEKKAKICIYYENEQFVYKYKGEEAC